MGVFWGVSLLPVQLPPRGLPTPPLAWRRRCDLRFTDGRLQLHRMRQLRRFVLMSDQGPADAGMPGRLALPEGLEELVVHTQGIWWVRAGRGGGMHLWVPHQDLHPYLTRGRWAHQPGAASMSNLSQPGPCNTPPPPSPPHPRPVTRPTRRTRRYTLDARLPTHSLASIDNVYLSFFRAAHPTQLDPCAPYPRLHTLAGCPLPALEARTAPLPGKREGGRAARAGAQSMQHVMLAWAPGRAASV